MSIHRYVSRNIFDDDGGRAYKLCSTESHLHSFHSLHDADATAVVSDFGDSTRLDIQGVRLRLTQVSHSNYSNCCIPHLPSVE